MVPPPPHNRCHTIAPRPGRHRAWPLIRPGRLPALRGPCCEHSRRNPAMRPAPCGRAWPRSAPGYAGAAPTGPDPALPPPCPTAAPAGNRSAARQSPASGPWVSYWSPPPGYGLPNCGWRRHRSYCRAYGRASPAPAPAKTRHNPPTGRSPGPGCGPPRPGRLSKWLPGWLRRSPP